MTYFNISNYKYTYQTTLPPAFLKRCNL